ncbi:tRNA(Ile)-lysidine synthase [Bradyrhizobium sp. NFR13]|jgi:tRNA(Ile)-lysidine synthase|uniref:tRNA lysidine(34) synthetase TilS n=1 Tax=Bradyrhizobium sp. NFR13 TaxID=1566285 RepID=UPI0008E9C67C|nr:tRNA lysidine(34) synthetase TilS [Bradyrhizobium sp. NFR13]SFL27721.1 tRNA(Ile)-lysidine synthase [Bradyrhizobium sp. NFR13]
MSDDDQSPISAQMAKQLFADWASAPALVLAVSGGPDSVALMWLAARWRRGLKRGPDLIAVTIDHGLRPEAALEARDVKRLAASLDIPHRTLRWTGAKPKTGLPAAARDARYLLLAKAARSAGASHVLTAHTRDDQAETLLMRMARGSGIAGLAGMARLTERDGIQLARPFLHVAKVQLVATLTKAKIDFATDPSNSDPSYTRPRLRALMPALASEGFDSRNLARLATRLRRADVALELMVDGAERFLALHSPKLPEAIDAGAFAGLAEEIRVRLLLRMIDQVGHEGPAELGKVETLVFAMVQAARSGGKGILLKQTLAGAMITLTHDRLRIVPAPPRRRRVD